MSVIASPIVDRRSAGVAAGAALVLGLLLGIGAVAATSNAGALVMVGMPLALALGLTVLLLAPGRLGDLLLLAAVAAITLPIKKHFDVQAGIVGWPGFRVSAADLPLLAALPVLAIGAWCGRTANVIPKTVLVLFM